MSKVPENLGAKWVLEKCLFEAVNFLLDEAREREKLRRGSDFIDYAIHNDGYDAGVAAEKARWGGIDNETSIASIAFEKGVEAERKRIREAVRKLPVMFPTDLWDEIHKAIDGDK